MSRKHNEVPEAKSLRWLANTFPFTEDPKDDTDKVSNAIHIYCEAGAIKIDELTKEVSDLKSQLEKERRRNNERKK